MFQLPNTDRLHPQSKTRGPWVLVGMLLVPVLGASVAYAVLATAWLPYVGLGGVDRIYQMGRHLDQLRATPPQPPFAVLLGDSVTMEGIDAAQVETQAPGWHVENLAIGGFGLNELRVLFPKLLQTKPDAISLALSPTHLFADTNIPLDKAYAYALGGFVASWREPPSEADLPGMAEDSFQALLSTKAGQMFHFRTAPMNWINESLRFRLRSDLRHDAATDWRSPHELLSSISDEVLQGRLNEIRRNHEKCLERLKTIPPHRIDDLVRDAVNSGSHVFLVISPTRPQLHASCAPLIEHLKQTFEQLASREGVTFVDAHDLLPEARFADGLHPNEEGRRIYSEYLGQQIKAQTPSPKP